MEPIAFTIFGIDIAWYGIIIAVGMILAVIVAGFRAKREGINEEIIIDLAIYAIPMAIVGARLYYVIFKWEYYLYHPIEIFRVREGGLAIHGGVIAGIIVGYFFCRYKKLEFWKMADICAPSIILGQAIGRWGNYFNKEAFGGPTDLPWAIEVEGQMVHPTFLYESIWNFIVFGFLLYYTKHKKYQGQIMILYLILYSAARFFIEGLRTDSLMVGPFRTAQIISVIAIIAAIYSGKILQKFNNYNE